MASPPSLFLRFATLIALLFSLSTLARAASSSSKLTPTSATAAATTPTATIFPGTSTYKYYGCYNETTLANGTAGLRALTGGTTEALDTMTVPLCLSFCAQNSYAFAGLEYTRECYCAPYLSALSSKVPDAECNLPCKGNSTEICGGSLKLSIYQTKGSTKGAGIKVKEAQLSSILALGIAIGFLLCLA